jgi:hypothetical protein
MTVQKNVKSSNKKKITPLQIEKIFHYPIDDEDCMGDYYTADLKIDGKLALSLTDQYHDNPTRQFEGFLAALNYLKIAYEVTSTSINDSDY